MIDKLIQEYMESLNLKRQQLIDTRNSKINEIKQAMMELRKPKSLIEKIMFKLTNKISVSKEFEISSQEEKYAHDINEINSEYNFLISDLDKVLNAPRYSEFIIDDILSDNQELLKDPNFIIELININPKYLIYDQTNNDDVYKEFFKNYE